MYWFVTTNCKKGKNVNKKCLKKLEPGEQHFGMVCFFIVACVLVYLVESGLAESPGVTGSRPRSKGGQH